MHTTWMDPLLAEWHNYDTAPAHVFAWWGHYYMYLPQHIMTARIGFRLSTIRVDRLIVVYLMRAIATATPVNVPAKSKGRV